jgi:hypothetical protein
MNTGMPVFTFYNTEIPVLQNTPGIGGPMHNIVNKRSPSYLNDMVTPCFVFHESCELRSGLSLSFTMKRTRLKFGDCAFSVAGPNAWNGLPVFIRFVQNTRSFKRQLNTLLFEVNL